MLRVGDKTKAGQSGTTLHIQGLGVKIPALTTRIYRKKQDSELPPRWLYPCRIVELEAKHETCTSIWAAELEKTRQAMPQDLATKTSWRSPQPIQQPVSCFLTTATISASQVILPWLKQSNATALETKPGLGEARQIS